MAKIKVLSLNGEETKEEQKWKKRNLQRLEKVI